ncbi:MAG: elongation factor P [Candidatus Nomurabacteria bacterium]|nr:elongation factor P [Candidatus Nomurabacteria bacterium]
MLTYNEIKERKYIIYEGEPYEVMSAHVARTQQRKPQNQVKMRNLINGRGVNATFRTSDKVEEADISKKNIKFLYQKKDEMWFAQPDNPKDRFQIPVETVGDHNLKFLRENEIVKALIFEYDDQESIIGIELPMKIEFKVKDCPPNIKGDTATGGNKVATLENGTPLNVPLFINPGDIIRVNTVTGEYVERAEKS